MANLQRVNSKIQVELFSLLQKEQEEDTYITEKLAGSKQVSFALKS